jgi:hypothetical protein
LFLPLLHNRDGDINQVDSRGRTLVHFAWHELLVRYLLGHGAPVPEGLRAPLLDALANPVGSKVFRANARPGYVDVDGRPVPAVMAFRGKDDPGFERCLRPVPNALVSQLASPMVVDGSELQRLDVHRDKQSAHVAFVVRLPPKRAGQARRL